MRYFFDTGAGWRWHGKVQILEITKPTTNAGNAKIPNNTGSMGNVEIVGLT
jgi:hypothetical protein